MVADGADESLEHIKPSSPRRIRAIERSVRLEPARHATDDSEPTPLMEDVKIKPVIGTPFRFDVFPDTGCYQSIISLDLVRTYGLNLDRGRVKKIKAVNGGRMECSGSVSFTVIYEGHETDVLALVTPALQNEILS